MSERKPTLTPNEVVAFNLRAARRHVGYREGLERSLTQEEAAERLKPYLGVQWSKATFSSAEVAAEGRVRQFDADEIVALAAAFDLPPSWFFIPPESAERVRLPKQEGGKNPRAISAGEIVDLLFGPEAEAALERRLPSAVVSHSPPSLSEERAESAADALDPIWAALEARDAANKELDWAVQEATERLGQARGTERLKRALTLGKEGPRE